MYSSGVRSERGGIISKFIFLIFLVFVLCALYVVRRPLLRMMGEIWITDEAPQRSDAIVVLGGDNYAADRAQEAAQLFKQGMAPTVVASGRFVRTYSSTAELTQRDLTERGVPTDAVIKLTHRAENTLQELIVIERLAAEKNWKKILIVTSNYHTRRTHMLCDGIFSQGIEVRVIAAPDSEYNPDDWWQHRLSQKIFFHELAGYVVGKWELRRAASQAPAAAPSKGVSGEMVPAMGCTVFTGCLNWNFSHVPGEYVTGGGLSASKSYSGESCVRTVAICGCVGMIACTA
jgi:uncharacterized SAM-binding protein YcdF (DUF218 family)